MDKKSYVQRYYSNDDRYYSNDVNNDFNENGLKKCQLKDIVRKDKTQLSYL